MTSKCVCGCAVERILAPGPPRRGQKGSLSGVPGTQGGPGFRIVRFRMQISSAQTMACGRDNVFLISGRNLNICRRYNVFLLIT